MFFEKKKIFIFLSVVIIIIGLFFINNNYSLFEGYTKDRTVKSNNCSAMNSLYGSNGIALYGYADHSGNPFNENGFEVLGCNPDGTLKLGERAIEATHTTPPTTLAPSGYTVDPPIQNSTPQANQISSTAVQSFSF